MAKGGYKGSSPARETSPEEYSGVWDIVEQYGEQKAGSWPFQEDDSSPKSLRFDGSSSYLSKTPTQAGNKRTWTFSFWVKRCNVSATQVIWMAYNAAIDEANYATISFTSTGQLRVGWAYGTYKTTTAQYRDPSAWMHCCISVDTNHAVASERVQIAINGVKQTEFAGSHNPDLGQQLAWNGAYLHHLGSEASQQYSHNYLSEIQFVDGQQLSCDEFGFFNGQGIWMPKRFTGDYASGPVYSNGLTASNGYHGSYPAPLAFDGSTTTRAGNNQSSGGGTLTLTKNITVANQIRVLTGIQNTVKINGTSIGTATGSDPAYVVSNAAYDVTEIVIEAPNSNGYRADLFAIEVDGVLLTDASVGRNSFHLDFSQDEAGEVKDQSGLSNDWTANNVDGPSKGLIAGITINAPSNVTLQSAEHHKMFNGDKTNYCYAHTNDATNYIQWTPAGGYSTNGHIWIQGGDGNGAGANTMEVQINGSVVSRSAVVDNETYTQAGYGWGDWHKYPVAGNTLTSLRLTGAYALIRQLSTVDDPTHSVLGISNDNDVPAIVDTLPSITDYFIDSPVNGNEASTGAGGERRGNYCCFNPLDKHGSLSVSDGNLKVQASTSQWELARSTFFLSSGKYYWEFTWTGGVTSSSGYQMGLKTPESTLSAAAQQAGSYAFQYTSIYLTAGSLNTVSVSPGSITSGDTVMFAYDADAGKMWLGVNGTWNGSGNPATGANPDWTGLPKTGLSPFAGCYGSLNTITLNAGQRAFEYTNHAGFSPLATSFLPEPTMKRGDEGFDIALWQGNGSTQTISGLRLNPGLVWIKTRDDAYGPALYDQVRGANLRLRTDDAGGTNPDQTQTDGLSGFTEDGFTLGNHNAINESPDDYVGWIWDAGDTTTTIAAGSLNSSVYDQSRTWSNDLSATNLANQTKMFDWTYGYGSYTGTCTWTTTNSAYSNLSGRVYLANNTTVGLGITFKDSGGNSLGTFTVAWTGDGTQMQDTGFNWSSSVASVEITGDYLPVRVQIGNKTIVDTGVTVPNFPSIDSTVRANPAAGFSIMTLTFPVYSGTSSVAHGLNSAPHFWVMKDRDSSDGWYFGHKSMGAGHYLRLESYGDKTASQYLWDNKLPDANVIYNNGTSMTGSGSYLMLAWAPIDGYSAMGSYEGTGAADSAAFVYTGMRPRWIMVKNIDTGDSSTDWFIYDTTRSTTNPVDDQLNPNRAIAEAASSTHAFDILSNGFRVRSTSTSGLSNKQGDTYIWVAFAEHPFASNCRAR